MQMNNKYIFSDVSPYRMKLVVIKEKNASEVLGNPTLIEPDVEIVEKKTLKEHLKSIPLIGWFLRWNYNLLRLNNLKHRVHRQDQTISNLHQVIEQQQTQIQQQQARVSQLEKTVEQMAEDQKVLFFTVNRTLKLHYKVFRRNKNPKEKFLGINEMYYGKEQFDRALEIFDY